MRSLILSLILLLTFCQSALAQSPSSVRSWPNDAAGRPAPPCTVYNPATNRVELCGVNGLGLPLSTTPNSTSDPSAYGKSFYAGTGAQGQYGFLDTTQTRASGPYFKIDNLNFVAVLGSDLDANVDIYRTADGGLTWGYPLTVATGVVGAINGGVTSTAASYFGKSQSVIRTVDFTTFSAIDVSSLVGLAGISSFIKGPTRLHFTASGTAASDKHICRSTAAGGLNPTALAQFECKNFPVGGQGINPGSVFMGGQNIVYVPTTAGTLIVVDNPQNSAVANIYRSTDEGDTWVLVTTLTALARDTVDDPGFGVNCNSQGTLCAVALGDRIAVSTDQGATWTVKITSATANLHGVAFFDEEPETIFVTRTGCSGNDQPMALRSPDSGETWVSITMGRCSVATGRHVNSVHTGGGRFLISQTSQTPNLAFAAAFWGGPTVGTVAGETKVTQYSRGYHVGEKATYSASIPQTATAAGTGVFAGMCGSASKTVRIKNVFVGGSVATAAVRATINLSSTTTATSAGTPSSMTQVPHDRRGAAGTATLVNFYTALATAGTGAVLATRVAPLPITATIAPTDPPMIEFNFTGIDREPITLRGTAQCIELAFAATTTNAPTLAVHFIWTEDVQ